MSLGKATLKGRPAGLTGSAPYDTALLRPLVGQDFDLPCEDPWLAKGSSRAHAYLESAAEAWKDTPEWMDFLDLSSPMCDLKRAERDLYLHHWAPYLEAQTVLDVGCGIGRFTAAMLDRGADVWAVDGDLLSLRRCGWHACNRPGRVELHWSSVHRLPEVQVDRVICAEVLCYVPKARQALAAMVDRLKPGGVMLISVEARWAWATAQDAPTGALPMALSGDGVLDLPGDRWVRTYEADDLTQLLEGAGLVVESMTPALYILDGPLEGVLPETASLEELVAFEEQCAAHPVWAPLNRLWPAAARKP